MLALWLSDGIGGSWWTSALVQGANVSRQVESRMKRMVEANLGGMSAELATDDAAPDLQRNHARQYRHSIDDARIASVQR
ncbi:unnamed protein product [Zymoseptoria tritici ST99CH_3D7]|uniref:Uncharacterized protein n=1 Tax=Zymoseptoria tritici (strain ST99CH_3D7) TaxID=1276538 RepID=A0A1X7S1N6_ZYMT9|nr:unnamed protein product [Zymoseptoria tritici ST99CH_3D7]